MSENKTNVEVSEASEIAKMKVRLAEIGNEISELCKSFNMAYMSEHIKLSEIAGIDNETKKRIDAYNELSQKICFQEILSSELPEIEAAMRYEFETINVKDKTKGESKIPVREVVYRPKPINLRKLDKSAESGIGKGNWQNAMQLLNKQLTLRAASRLGCPPERISEIDDTFMMKNIVKMTDNGKNPTSNNQISKTLHEVIAKILGDEYTPNKWDLNYLVDVYAKASTKSALRAQCANDNKISNLILRICHRIVTNGVWDVEFKTIKRL